MRERIVIWILTCVALATGAFGQEDEESIEKIGLRVTATPTPSTVVVDRGASDGLEIGDLVVFQPRQGGTFQGSVTSTDERSAVVELLDKSAVLAIGTRGTALVPSARFETPVVPLTPEDQGDTGELWQNDDEGYSQDMPLLAEINAVRPEERQSSVTGRLYFIGDGTWTSQDNRSDSFLRFGQNLRIDNPFKRGGGILIDLEQNYRATDLPDQVNEDTAYMRVDRLSYYEGGTRFDNRRWEAGRFLQHGVPEFGLVDGAEYTQRLDNGHSFGGSVGFMPEPFGRLESGHDFQVAGYYRWVSEASEQLSATGGFQKSFHNGAADRNLVVAKVQYLPLTGWDFNGTAWVDINSGDSVKSGLSLTQAFLSTSRRWDNGDGVNITFNHWEFPDIQRVEFRPVLEDQIANSHNDRLAFSGWRQVAVDQRAHAELGVWADQDEAGGDASVGIEFAELIGSRSTTDVTFFGSSGRFSQLLGARVRYGKVVPSGRWDLFYEFAQNDQEGFDSTQDNFIQHRIRATRNMNWVPGWNLSVYAESLLWADENSWALGVYLQKGF